VIGLWPFFLFAALLQHCSPTKIFGMGFPPWFATTGFLIAHPGASPAERDPESAFPGPPGGGYPSRTPPSKARQPAHLLSIWRTQFFVKTPGACPIGTRSEAGLPNEPPELSFKEHSHPQGPSPGKPLQGFPGSNSFSRFQ
jgi:hypothetical protein